MLALVYDSGEGPLGYAGIFTDMDAIDTWLAYAKPTYLKKYPLYRKNNTIIANLNYADGSTYPMHMFYIDPIVINHRLDNFTMIEENYAHNARTDQ